MRLVDDTTIERVFKYEVDEANNKYYLSAIRLFDSNKYSASRYFIKENGKVYMVVTVKLIDN